MNFNWEVWYSTSKEFHRDSAVQRYSRNGNVNYRPLVLGGSTIGSILGEHDRYYVVGKSMEKGF
jgi:hypothetical protein